jgi:hypothetical protein
MTASPGEAVAHAFEFSTLPASASGWAAVGNLYM